jgi:hypothetical protein
MLLSLIEVGIDVSGFQQLDGQMVIQRQ